MVIFQKFIPIKACCDVFFKNTKFFINEFSNSWFAHSFATASETR